MMMRGKCRVWWPKQLCSVEKPVSTILFGWCLRSSSNSSLDVVVVDVVASPDTISHCSHHKPDLQEILRLTNENMPFFLQDKSSFSVLGHCAADCDLNGHIQSIGMVEKHPTKTYNITHAQKDPYLTVENYGQWSCGCHKLDGVLEQYRKSSTRNSDWFQFSFDSVNSCKDISWIPKLHHMHWDGHIVTAVDVHVIIYEPSIVGVHHFSLNSWNIFERVSVQVKRPMWVDKLHRRNPPVDLDTVIWAVNCAAAAKVFIDNRVIPQNSCNGKPGVSMLVSIARCTTAVFTASFFTLFYIILQLCHCFLNYGSQSHIYMIVRKLFCHTWKNIHIRSCQLLYWPIFLQDISLRSHSSVEYVHRAALHKHSMWSSAVIDIIMGNIIGFALLRNTEAVYASVLNFAHDTTSNLLRSGCVWLMGVPAGFKLNTELAGVFGMISLNATQIWSSLWFCLHYLLRYFIQGLAVSGIILGVTIPAAVIIDMIMLATIHVSVLHRMFSLLYSLQIQALTALWRLFRGRKWNTLRQRFDSYDYTVKQHAVGSLLFTPLLLLLPTTSVFYIFFTILSTTTSFICIMIEVTISILHATPYTKIFLRIVRPSRFPAGIWFEVVWGQSTDSSEAGSLGKGVSQLTTMGKESDKGQTAVVSFLRSNISSIGEIILPHYRSIFRGVSSGTLSGYGILTGRRIPTSLHTGLPSTMPWLHMTISEYWWLCYDSVLKCSGVSNCVRTHSR